MKPGEDGWIVHWESSGWIVERFFGLDKEKAQCLNAKGEIDEKWAVYFKTKPHAEAALQKWREKNKE